MGDVIQQIKDRLNIIDVISPYVELHKSGKNFKGKSPFSAEKTPSFYVSPDRGMYYCFSTSQGGDIFNFVQVMEGVNFKEALKILAQKAGVELVPEDPQKKSERDRLYQVLDLATAFFEKTLTTNQEALSYLSKRGVKPETLAKWRIGYAPGPPLGGWRELKLAMEEQGFGASELLLAGLVKRAEGGKEPYDVFRHRVMFPLSEPSGKVVAFSGRLLSGDVSSPKYVNSPETPLYKKSDLLFGYDKAKQSIRQLDFSLIVEGQFDVVMCHQAGYTNTVAVSGTALTLHHVQLLERLSPKVVLALDADRAGISAMKKASSLMLGRGLDVKVAELPMGQDPADLILADQAQFKKIVGQSVSVIEFLLHVLRREISDDRSFKLKVSTEVLPFILLLPNRIDQEHFMSKVATAIKASEDAVRYELQRLREKAETDESALRHRGIDSVQKMEVATERVGGEQAERAYLFLQASCSVISPSASARLALALQNMQNISELPAVSQSELAGTIFSLEQQFAKLPEQIIMEEVVAKLNQLKLSLIRRCLSDLRQGLLALEAVGDETGALQALDKIRAYETQRREPPCEIVDIFADKG